MNQTTIHPSHQSVWKLVADLRISHEVLELYWITHLWIHVGPEEKIAWSELLCVVFIAQISHYGKFTALHKLISIVLQLTNQIMWKFPTKSCGDRAIFSKLLWGQGCNIRHTSHLKTQSVNIMHHGQESILFLSAKI